MIDVISFLPVNTPVHVVSVLPSDKGWLKFNFIKTRLFFTSVIELAGSGETSPLELISIKVDGVQAVIKINPKTKAASPALIFILFDGDKNSVFNPLAKLFNFSKTAIDH